MYDLTRRDALKAAGVLSLAALIEPSRFAIRSASAEEAVRPLMCALHVHSSFSEGHGSMEAQMASAAAAGVDVLWFTDHDWRLSQYGYRQVVHFNGMSEAENGLNASWQRVAAGTLATAGASFVSSPVSPLDPSGGKAMKITAATAATATSFAYNRYQLIDTAARQNTTGTLNGVELQIEVLPQQFGADAFVEVLVRTSYRPALGGRPAGEYQISYRLGGPAAVGTYFLGGTGAQALNGVVTLPAKTGAWQSLRLNPAADMARLWPDLRAPGDIGLIGLLVGVASRHGKPATGVFDYLRFSRNVTGAAAMDAQRAISASLAAAFPSLTQHQGLEVSLTDAHVNWFGGNVAPLDYTGQKVLPPNQNPAQLVANIQQIHAAGGLASYNHMFGSGNGAVVDATTQDSKRAAVARMLLDSYAFGADMLEIYRQRNGVGIERHLQAWDVCSRNGIFLTGTGVNDNHGGKGWATEVNNLVTWTFAASSTETDLLAGFASGRAFFGDQVLFRGGSIDLLVDGTCPMGSVSTSTDATRQVAITASGLPVDGAVRLVQGAVDYSNTTEPLTLGATTVPADAFAAGEVPVVAPNSASSFVRAEVLDGTGSIIAASNPAWLLREEPPRGYPTARLVS